MMPRYSHPLVTELWSPLWTYNTWLEIERHVLRAQRKRGTFDHPGSLQLLRRLELLSVAPADVEQIAQIEARTKHDVAAFLEWVRLGVPEGTGQYLHYGLTSSDLVDTAQAIRFRELQPVLRDAISGLNYTIDRWVNTAIPVLGRTHGEAAEPTSMQARANHWLATLHAPTVHLLATSRRHMKLSGPVGTFAHNPPEMEAMVADALKLPPQGVGSSQIVPRSGLALWAAAAASFAASCAKIATDVRLMCLMNEVYWPQSEGQVGSSAMAHKNNPIVAEQVCGLAQVAQGYATMLQPLSLWLERDISHSCVERIAVPDLWHVLLQTIAQTTKMLEEMVLQEVFVESNLEDNPFAWVHALTLARIKEGETLQDSREAAMIGAMHNDLEFPPEYFMRQYPQKANR